MRDPQWRPVPSTNGLAIASFILGLLWVFWIGSLLALIFGYIAMGEIRRTGQRGDGLATAGVVLGWTGVATFLFVVWIYMLGA